MKTGRGRGKGKKQSLTCAFDDAGSGEDEKFATRRRGRPQKPLKDDIEHEVELEKMEKHEGNEDTKMLVFRDDNSNLAAAENGKKRKTPQVKENENSVNEENGSVAKTDAADFIKAVGFRQVGSRRKNKPRRAAEVGVECI